MEGPPHARSQRLSSSAPLPAPLESIGGASALPERRSNGTDPSSATRLADPFAAALRLSSEGVAFVLMTVVRAVAPTSAKAGDKAIWTERGEWLGWVGGSCAEPAARRAAHQALADGQCRLLHLTNDEAHLSRPGVELAAMSCYSGGSLEIYVEPHLAQPSLVVFGRSPNAEALCQLGLAMGYGVTQVDLRAAAEEGPAAAEARSLPELRRVRRFEDLSAALGSASFVVVASHGHFEVEALEWALRGKAAYVGLVTSRRRWPEVRARLEQRGLGKDAERVHAPAGLELGAARPEEVALSVLSQIVAERRGGARAGVPTPLSEGSAPVGGAVRTPSTVTAPLSARANDVLSGSEPPASCCAAERPPAIASTASDVSTASDCCAPAPSPKRELSPTRSVSAESVPRRSPRFSAIVLAAGLSRRMGAANKLLLSVDGEPMIRRTVRTVQRVGVAELVVVLGHQANEVAAALEPLGVRTRLNADFASGQVSSVRAGLAALTLPTDAVLICLGDQPLLEISDLGALKRAFRERPHGSIVVPHSGERRGNPVVVDWASAQETLQHGTNYGCRHFMDEHPERVYRWPAPNDHFVVDIDQPEDYRALGGRARP